VQAAADGHAPVAMAPLTPARCRIGERR
jgi:hypothetical protein